MTRHRRTQSHLQIERPIRTGLYRESAAGNPAHSQWSTLSALFAVQAFSQSGQTLIVTLSALTAVMLTDSVQLATLPIALQFLGTTVSAIPVSFLMHHFGRRTGFMLGQTVGVLAAVIAVTGIMLSNFWLFASAALLFGYHNASWQHLRYAAAEAVDEARRPRAISLVVSGGLVAAFLGPLLALQTQGFIAGHLYAGGYAAIGALCIVNLALLVPPRFGAQEKDGRGQRSRPLSEIWSEPKFQLAVASSAVGAGVMVALMTATPLAMAHASHGFAETAHVIQWHIVAMYLPSFFTGRLIERFGFTAIIATGLAVDFLAFLIHMTSDSVAAFWTGLFLVGLGWNLLFVGGTALVAEQAQVGERARVQASNEFVIFTASASASLLAGVIFAMQGWAALNLGMIAPIALVAFLLFRANAFARRMPQA